MLETVSVRLFVLPLASLALEAAQLLCLVLIGFALRSIMRRMSVSTASTSTSGSAAAAAAREKSARADNAQSAAPREGERIAAPTTAAADGAAPAAAAAAGDAAAAPPRRTWSRPQIVQYLEIAAARGGWKLTEEQIETLYLTVALKAADADGAEWSAIRRDAFTHPSDGYAREQWLAEPHAARARAVAASLRAVYGGDKRAERAVTDALAMALRATWGITPPAPLPSWTAPPHTRRPDTTDGGDESLSQQSTQPPRDATDDDSESGGDTAAAATAEARDTDTRDGNGTTADNGKTWDGEIVDFQFRNSASDAAKPCGHEHQNDPAAPNPTSCKYWYRVQWAKCEGRDDEFTWMPRANVPDEHIARFEAKRGITRPRARTTSNASQRSNTSNTSNAPAPAAATAAAPASTHTGKPAKPAAPATPAVPATAATTIASSHTNGQFSVFDVPGDGACGAHALAVATGADATTLAHIKRVYDSTAAELKRRAEHFAADIADEDQCDAKTAVQQRIASLRAPTLSHNMTHVDIDAYTRSAAHAVRIVAAHGSDIAVTQFGRGTASRTAVLIHCGGHYRVLVPAHTKAGEARTFTADTVDDAIEFARAHARAWLNGATAPPFPDRSSAERKQRDTPPNAAAPAPAAANSGGGWKPVTGKMTCVERLTPALTLVVNAGANVTDITAIEQRIERDADVTLSAFTRRYTIAAGGVVHVEALSQKLYAALLDAAAAIRVRTHKKKALIDITPLIPPRPTPTTTAPERGRGRGRDADEHERGRTRGGRRGRGRGRGADDTPHTSSGADHNTEGEPHAGARGGAKARGRGNGRGRKPTAAEVMREQLELIKSLMPKHTDLRTNSRSPRRTGRPQPGPIRCGGCGKPAHDGHCAPRYRDTNGDAETDGPTPLPSQGSQSQRRRREDGYNGNGRGDGSGEHRYGSTSSSDDR